MSTLDDGFYAYAAEAILEGKLIHRDFFSQYLGYQHYIHASFFWLFGSDYVVLRYWLIVVQFACAYFSALIFRSKGWQFQIMAALAVTGFGIVLFNNPSTGWTCVGLTLAIIYSISSEEGRPQNYARLVTTGVLLGVMAGIRHPTAIFVGMAVLVHVIINSKTAKDVKQSNSIASRSAITLLLLVAATSLLIYMRAASTFLDLLPWFIAPFSYLGYTLLQLRHINCAAALKKLFLVLAGFLLAIAPVIALTTVNNSWSATFVDLMTLPSNYSSMLGLTTFDVAGNMIFTARESLNFLNAVGLVIALIALFFPMTTAFAMWIGSKRPVLRAWIESPLTIFAAFHALVIVALISTIYSAYILPLEILSLIYLISISPKGWWGKAVLTAISTMALISTAFIYPEINTKANFSFFGGSRIKSLSDCWLPRCSLKISSGNARISSAAYKAVEQVKRPNSTVIVLPWGYHYEFSYPAQNRPAYPDYRIPLYRGVPADIAYKELMKAQDPVILIAKPSMRDESTYREFEEFFARDFYKSYDSPIYMVLIKKHRAVN